MRRNDKKILGSLHLIITTLGILVLIGMETIVRAEPLQLEMTLTGGQTFMKGEPIVVHYVITNTSSLKMDVNMGLDGALGGTEWVSRSLKPSFGGTIPPLLDPRPVDKGGLHFDEVRLDSNQSKEGSLVIGQWFASLSPGRYALTLRIHLNYGLGQSVDESSQNCISSPTAFSQDYDIPLQITPADPQRIKALATSLEKMISQTKDSQQKVLLLKELACIPEAQAGDSWANIAKDKELQTTLADELRYFPSERTADILAQMLWPEGEAADQGPRAEASKNLREMYNASNGILKAHIRHLYAQQGIDAPDYFPVLHNGG